MLSNTASKIEHKNERLIVKKINSIKSSNKKK